MENGKCEAALLLLRAGYKATRAVWTYRDGTGGGGSPTGPFLEMIPETTVMGGAAAVILYRDHWSARPWVPDPADLVASDWESVGPELADPTETGPSGVASVPFPSTADGTDASASPVPPPAPVSPTVSSEADPTVPASPPVTSDTSEPAASPAFADTSSGAPDPASPASPPASSPSEGTDPSRVPEPSPTTSEAAPFPGPGETLTTDEGAGLA